MPRSSATMFRPKSSSWPPATTPPPTKKATPPSEYPKSPRIVKAPGSKTKMA